MSEYVGVVEQAKIIRNNLKKEMGLNSRKVSVKSAYCGYSTKIDVVIKDLSIDIKKVEKIANEFYSVDRCERTGEILQGGNTYIFCKYDWELEQAERERKEQEKNN